MIIRVFITIALFFSLTSTILAQEQEPKTLQVLVGVMRGVSVLNHDIVNRALEEYHGLEGIPERNPASGVRALFILWNKLVFGMSSLQFPEYIRENNEHYKRGVTLQRSTVLGKLGFVPFSTKQNYLFPYIGLAYETMKASKDFPYYMKSPDALWGGHGTRVDHNLAFVYGLEFTLVSKGPIGLGLNLEIGDVVGLQAPIYRLFGAEGIHTLVRKGLHSPVFGWNPGGLYIRGNIFLAIRWLYR